MTTTNTDWCGVGKHERVQKRGWISVSRIDYIEMSDPAMNHYAGTGVVINADRIVMIEPVSIRYGYGYHEHCKVTLDGCGPIMVEQTFAEMKRMLT